MRQPRFTLPVPEGLTLCAEARARIGARLRAEYAGFTGAGLPERHIHLLLELRRREREMMRR